MEKGNRGGDQGEGKRKKSQSGTEEEKTGADIGGSNYLVHLRKRISKRAIGLGDDLGLDFRNLGIRLPQSSKDQGEIEDAGLDGVCIHRGEGTDRLDAGVPVLSCLCLIIDGSIHGVHEQSHEKLAVGNAKQHRRYIKSPFVRLSRDKAVEEEEGIQGSKDARRGNDDLLLVQLLSEKRIQRFGKDLPDSKRDRKEEGDKAPGMAAFHSCSGKRTVSVHIVEVIGAVPDEAVLGNEDKKHAGHDEENLPVAKQDPEWFEEG